MAALAEMMTNDIEWVSPGDPDHNRHVHSAYNPGTGPTVFIATFFEAPETGPLLIAGDPAC